MNGLCRYIEMAQDPRIYEKLVQAIVQKPATAVRMGKELLYRQRELGLQAAYQLAGEVMACNMMDADAQEGAQAFAQKRVPHWRQ